MRSAPPQKSSSHKNLFAPGEPVIDIEKLEVAYGEVKAVRGLSFQVKQGEIFGILGPNGAGKTTTLSVIEGLVKPQAGRVTVLGYDVLTHPVKIKRLLGLSLQTTTFFDLLKIWELVQFYAGLYEVFLSKSETLKILGRFDLTEKAHLKAHELSGGQQQRLALTLALVNDPQIVILDEPTTGLDPQARRTVWEVVRQIRAEGRTVVLTTHYMEEAQELCHRVGIIDRGQIIALDTPGGLINGLKATARIVVTAQLPEQKVLALPGVSEVKYEGDKLQITSTNSQETSLALQQLAVENRQLLTDLSIKQPDLEDVFISMTGRKIAG